MKRWKKMRGPSFIVLPLLFVPLLLAAYGSCPVLAQTDHSGIMGSAERSALEAAVNVKDPAERARALEEFLTRYPHSSEQLTALATAMDAFEQAGDVMDAKLTANTILQLKPDDARALALIASANAAATRMRVGEFPADPIAAAICRLEASESQLSFSDWEDILSLRDISPCNHAAADWIWAGILKHQEVFKIGARAKVLSSTTDTIIASTLDSDVYNTNARRNCESLPCSMLPQSGTGDLRVTLRQPLPYAYLLAQ